MDTKSVIRYGWRSYGASIVLVAAAAAVRLLPLQSLGVRLPWLTFYPAVMLAALYGGLPAGLLGAVLSCLTVLFLFPIVVHHPVIGDSAEWLGMAVFFVTSTIISGFAESMRRAAAREKLVQQDIRRLNAALERRVRDRTADLEAANATLRHDEARLRSVFEHLSEGLVVSDLNGDVLYFNGAAMRIHGFTDKLEYLRALPDFADTFEIAGRDGVVWPVDQWPLARILRGETVHDLQVSVRHIGAGWQRLFSYGGGLIRDSDGQPVLALVTIRDVSDQKRSEGA